MYVLILWVTKAPKLLPTMQFHPFVSFLSKAALIISAMLAYTLPLVNDVWNASCAVSMALH